MREEHLKHTLVVAALVTVVLLAGCNKKAAKVTPPTPPPAPAPTASLTASPDSIHQGQSTQLSWTTQNATQIAIAGLGTVPASGTKTVNPADSTTYRLEAKGPGGTTEASARVTVTMPPPTAASQPSLSELFARNVKDIFFDFNKYDVRADQQQAARVDAQFLLQHPEVKLMIEGHCDDRGSEEYNLGLGDNRAQTLKSYLLQAGISADRIRTISYGKEKPFCNQDDEQCWQQNRRDHFAMQQ